MVISIGFARVGSKFIVTVSDCTGHGVPGALMSMVGNELLNNAVHMRGLTSPDDILTDMSQNLRVSLKQVQTGNRDGMDMGLWWCMTWKQENGVCWS